MSEPAAQRHADELRSVPLVDVLSLDRIDRELFRSAHLFEVDRPLYGGQVLAQALLACGATVDPDRLPHSLHGYFLRRGDSACPVLFRVDNDRDGRSYSARRVVAVQDGEVIFSMSASFRTPADGEEHTGSEVTPTAPPERCRAIVPDPELALQVRVQDWSVPDKFFPVKFWVRPNGDLPQDDPLMHAAAIAYMSDFSTGLRRTVGSELLGPSLDHALWFHRTPRWDDWLFVDHAKGVSAGMRGWYTGTVIDSGEVVASLAQEMAYHDTTSRREKTAAR
ncbi:acyl-CoA thioesterase II [Nocardia nova]|uniref:Acyl-CoA thioesterase II n=1 Tax=Nocardia nova TaxID=37330 RepID=A0A2S6AN14_9NOCA|nr:acyl-CoA thioesterase domain-containing protein [Nocardia nova]PPJ25725.1 acyl-CoA thioesterase II [Nocardia nova]PPJ36647.1 acyl-CoA thioesterase II [Nocardia nova]